MRDCPRRKQKDRKRFGKISPVELPQGVSTGGKNPEGGGQIIEKGSSGDGNPVENGGFDGAFRHDEVDEQIQDEHLNGKRKECGGVVVESLAPMRGPVVKGPPGVEEVVGAAADDPREGGHAGDHGMVGGMPPKVVVTEG